VDLTPLLAGGANGGVKPFIVEQLRWLTQQVDHPLEFLFLTRESSHEEVKKFARESDECICLFCDWGQEAHRHGLRPERALSDFEIYRILESKEADLLYAPFGWVRHYLPGIPVIALIVDLLHRDYPASLPMSEVQERERVFQKCVSVADRFQCISDETAKALCDYFPVERERTFRTHIVIHGRLADQQGGQNRRSSDQAYFLYPANAWKHKNHHTFLIGYAKYVAEMGAAAWDLVLTGHDDDAMREVLETAVTLGVADRVQYEGHLELSDFAHMWRGAGALVFPSLHEGFGIPLLEAMQMRLPILCGDHATLLEVAGDACLAIDVRKPLVIAEALARVAGEPELRADLVSRGEQRLDAFDFERECRALLKAMIELKSKEARATRRGVDDAGRLEGFSAFLIPMGHPLTIRCRFRVGATSRRCRVYCGGVLFADWSLPAEEEVTRELTWEPLVDRVILELLPSPNVSESVVLEEMLCEQEGEVQTLFTLENEV